MEWNKAKQIAMKGKVDAEAKKLAKRLGAHSVYVVAHFADDLDPDALHSMKRKKGVRGQSDVRIIRNPSGAAAVKIVLDQIPMVKADLDQAEARKR